MNAIHCDFNIIQIWLEYFELALILFFSVLYLKKKLDSFLVVLALVYCFFFIFIKKKF